MLTAVKWLFFKVLLSPQRLLLTEQNKNCNATVQISDGMLRKHFCIKDLCLYFKNNRRKNLQADNCAKECQLNREKPGGVKDNSYKLSNYFPPHQPWEPILGSTKANIVGTDDTPRGVTLLEKAFLILSDQH